MNIKKKEEVEAVRLEDIKPNMPFKTTGSVARYFMRVGDTGELLDDSNEIVAANLHNGDLEEFSPQCGVVLTPGYFVEE